MVSVYAPLADSLDVSIADHWKHVSSKIAKMRRGRQILLTTDSNALLNCGDEVHVGGMVKGAANATSAAFFSFVGGIAALGAFDFR